MADQSDEYKVISDEMLHNYRGKVYTSIPDDPRQIDVSVISALKERLSSPYSYRWREREADIEIAQALYGKSVSNSGSVIYYRYESLLLDKNGDSPPMSASPISWDESDGYFLRYYVTIAEFRISRYIHDMVYAESLLNSIFPGSDYTLIKNEEGYKLKIEDTSYVGSWVRNVTPARAIVIALLERLEIQPDLAAAWRSPP
ncbi:hypothetical protein [Methylobacterium thuringiense]|uniref:hypothetical protein n=1 Tax=Methylobacterium thuringiense TaxID=1003091 RepID=UPI001EDE84C9|nr:hypothetical protein [Methylobacterium thuringiense]